VSGTGSAAERLSLSTIVVFSLSTMPVAALGVVLLVYLPPYLAGHLGVSLGVIGGVWMAVRLIDLFVDPTLAHFMDKTETRFGRYRAWLAGGVPLNDHGLADFRVEQVEVLDRLLTQSVTALIAEGLVRLAEIAVDGTKIL